MHLLQLPFALCLHMTLVQHTTLDTGLNHPSLSPFWKQRVFNHPFILDHIHPPLRNLILTSSLAPTKLPKICTFSHSFHVLFLIVIIPFLPFTHHIFRQSLSLFPLSFQRNHRDVICKNTLVILTSLASEHSLSHALLLCSFCSKVRGSPSGNAGAPPLDQQLPPRPKGSSLVSWRDACTCGGGGSWRTRKMINISNQINCQILSAGWPLLMGKTRAIWNCS